MDATARSGEGGAARLDLVGAGREKAGMSSARVTTWLVEDPMAGGAMARLAAADMTKPDLKQSNFLGPDVSVGPTDLDPMVVSW
jgi:hypothetical protein